MSQNTVDGEVVYPITYRVIDIPGGAGFLPQQYDQFCDHFGSQNK